MFLDSFKGRKLFLKKYLNKNVTQYIEQQLCVVPVRWMHSREFPCRRQSRRPARRWGWCCRAHRAPVPLPAPPGALLGQTAPRLSFWGNKPLNTFHVFETWCIVNPEIWFKKTKHLLNCLFFWVTCWISGPHLYTLLWGRGCRTWSEAVILFQLNSTGPVLAVCVIPTAWHTASW